MVKTVLNAVTDGENVLGYDVDDRLLECAVAAIARNNTFVPNIERVVFNTNADGERPVLATVVYFRDGTKVTVKNSAMDEVKLVDRTVKLSDGTERKIRTASRESLEAGLIYAIAKRVICGFDDNGNVQGTGFAKFLEGQLKDAHVQDVEDFKVAEERRIARKGRQASEQKPPKKENLRDTVKALSKTVADLGDIVKGFLGGKKDDAGAEG